jgi:hypothetical protein
MREVETVKVYVTPGHAPDMWPPLLKAMTQGNPDFVFPSEFYRLAGERVPGYRTIVTRSTTDSRAVNSPHGDAGDNPILVAEKHKVIHRKGKRLSPYLPHSKEGGKYGPERWGYTADINYGHGVRLISVHPQPFGVSRADWVKAMRWVRAQIIEAHRFGLAVILAGDLQTAGRLVPFMLRGLGMKTFRVGICWLAWSGLREVPGTRRTVHHKGMDHEWFGLSLVSVPDAATTR